MGEPAITEDRLSKIFAGYLSLQGESYEFIARTIAMHNWLKEAYGVWQKSPELSAEELHQAWRPAFSQVYRHLFAAFLRPYRMIMGPFGEFLRTQLDSVASGSATDACIGMFKSWGEGQNEILKSFAGACQSYSRQCQHYIEHADTAAIDGVCQLTPFGLVAGVADEELSAQFETIQQLLQTLGEDQFFFPKTLVLHLQKAMATYPKAVRLAQRYESMFSETWEESTRKFAARMTQEGRPDFKVFFDTFRSVLAEEYGALLRSPEFIEVQSSFMQTVSELVIFTRGLLEAQLEMFPALPFATTKQLDAMARNAHSEKRRIDAVERKLRTLGTRNHDAARIDALERRVQEMEAQLKVRAAAMKAAVHSTPVRVKAASLS